MSRVFYTCPPGTVGKHEWRILVLPYAEGTPRENRCTLWQWRRIGSQTWNHQRDWPRYNSDDTYSGLPRGLDRIYHAHEAEIRTALHKPPLADPLPAQACLPL